MNFSNLKDLTRDQLVELAMKQGLPKPHPKAKPETIIKHIVDNVQAAKKPEISDLTDPRLKSKKEPVFNTEEQVEQALAQVKAKQPKFITTYADNTVKFSCLGAEETHNMSVPLHWLVKRAQLISRGRQQLMALNPHFDSLASATGKNAYTNTVIA